MHRRNQESEFLDHFSSFTSQSSGIACRVKKSPFKNNSFNFSDFRPTIAIAVLYCFTSSDISQFISHQIFLLNHHTWQAICRRLTWSTGMIFRRVAEWNHTHYFLLTCKIIIKSYVIRWVSYHAGFTEI
jgi:hypothetical protein